MGLFFERYFFMPFKPRFYIQKKVFFFCFLIFFLLIIKGKAQENSLSIQAEILISRLDLSGNGLDQVKQNQNNTQIAAEKLLDYFRQRNSVNHPINRNLKDSSKGNIAFEKDIETANNALKHIFVGQPAYPPYFCGNDIDWGTRPVPDNEWVWQLNRMSFWDAMAKAYWHTGDEKYAKV
jgi:heparan-sulfate lyase